MNRFGYVPRLKARKLRGTFGPGGGPPARKKRLQQMVTALTRHERIESTHTKCDETRGYMEQLIDVAMRNGDKDKQTMEIADHWLLEKDLIHKLFKVLVPRYENKTPPFTKIHLLPRRMPGDGKQMAVLELKGNPWPPVTPRKLNTEYLLSNILLKAASEDYRQEKEALINSKIQTSSYTSLNKYKSSVLDKTKDVDNSKTDFGSSVDGPEALSDSQESVDNPESSDVSERSDDNK